MCCSTNSFDQHGVFSGCRYVTIQGAGRTQIGETSRQTALMFRSFSATSPDVSLVWSLNLLWWRAACTRYGPDRTGCNGTELRASVVSELLCVQICALHQKENSKYKMFLFVFCQTFVSVIIKQMVTSDHNHWTNMINVFVERNKPIQHPWPLDVFLSARWEQVFLLALEESWSLEPTDGPTFSLRMFHQGVLK